MVGPGRLELPTSRLSGVRSNQLSYGPSKGYSGQKPKPDTLKEPLLSLPLFEFAMAL